VKDAQDLAGLAAGNESDEYLSRDPRDSRMIAGYEQQLIAGHKRVEELVARMAGVTAVRQTCLARFPYLPG
jgi:hypothetical protein